MKKLIEKSPKRAMIMVLLGVVFIILSDILIAHVTKPRKVTFHEYLNDLKAGEDIVNEDGSITVVPDLIDTVYFSKGGDTWRYTMWNKKSLAAYEEWIAEGKSPADFKYRWYKKSDYRYFDMPMYTVEFLLDHLEKYEGSSFRIMQDKDFEPLTVQLFPMFGSTLFMILFMSVFFTIYAKKMNSIGGIEKDLFVRDTGIKFEDVIGHDEAIEELQLIVKLMQESKKKKEAKEHDVALDRYDARIPRGILFTGPPGTGKTLLAKALAGEAGVPFLSMNSSALIEQYVGVGAKRVRELFTKAKKNAPCIVFLDEIDAVGTDRSVAASGEQKQTINALLQEMDGFETKEGVFVIAATNLAQSLDKALVRSGRFDREIVVPPPSDYRVRAQLFVLYLKNDPCSADIEAVAKECVGFTGADISAICNEARLIAISQNAESITTSILEEAVDRKAFKGSRKKQTEYKEELKIIAIHEAGHALVNVLSDVPIARATIIGNTGGAGGAVFREDDKKILLSKTDMEKTIMAAYGGRAAEELFFGKENVTTGAENDIKQATALLKKYVGTFGFDDETGKITLSDIYEDKLNEHLMQSVHRLSESLYYATYRLLEKNRHLLEQIADALLSKETLTGDEILKILQKEKQLKAG